MSRNYTELAMRLEAEANLHGGETADLLREADDAITELLKDRDRLNFIDMLREDVVGTGPLSDQELEGHTWSIYGQCQTIREAIDRELSFLEVE